MKPGLRVHIVTVGFQVRRITEPLIREKADKVYLLTRSPDDKATAYLDKVMKILRKERHLQIEKRTMDIWDRSNDTILSHNTSGISYADSTPVSSDITTNNKMA